MQSIERKNFPRFSRKYNEKRSTFGSQKREGSEVSRERKNRCHTRNEKSYDILTCLDTHHLRKVFGDEEKGVLSPYGKGGAGAGRIHVRTLASNWAIPCTLVSRGEGPQIVWEGKPLEKSWKLQERGKNSGRESDRHLGGAVGRRLENCRRTNAAYVVGCYKKLHRPVMGSKT